MKSTQDIEIEFNLESMSGMINQIQMDINTLKELKTEEIQKARELAKGFKLKDIISKNYEMIFKKHK